MLVLLGTAAAGLRLLPHGEEVPLSQPLADFPLVVGEWHGQDLPIEPRLIEAARVDGYLSRSYADGDGERLILYVGYYRSQRTGQTIHSPKNCLPGAGWQPVRAGRAELAFPSGEKASVNLYIIEKGLERWLVLYWYQSHGRIIASEYWGKIYMVVDAIRLNRTDSALVRVMTPLGEQPEIAERKAIALAERVAALLRDWLPA